MAQREQSTTTGNQRERLKAAHRHTACRLGVLFDERGVPVAGLVSANTRATIRRHVTRLANMVGVVSFGLGPAEAFTRAMFETYARASRGEDVSKAQRLARLLRLHTEPRSLLPGPGAPAVGKGSASRAVESEPVRTRRELLETVRREGARIDEAFIKRHQLGALGVSHDDFARYGIRKGDAWRFTLDGDAEHGELAVVTFYDGGRGRASYAAFLVVEGEHFCLRRNSPLECDDFHREPQLLTVIGRVVRVERAGLPVRLRGLELRGLPYAEDETAVEEPRRRAA